MLPGPYFSEYTIFIPLPGADIHLSTCGASVDTSPCRGINMVFTSYGPGNVLVL